MLAVFSVCAVVAASVFLLPRITQAANCGGATVCACGDTVTASTTLTGNLTCAGNGLVVGANNITIDGGNYTITGDRGLYDYGINNSSGYDSVTVKNLSVTNFNYGVYLFNSSGSTIQNITAYSNRFYGIYLLSSNSNTLTNNTVYSNELTGIQLQGSSLNTLTNNTMSGNGNNLYIYTLGDLSKYNNTINTTNKVEGKSVYYFYNNDGTAGSPLIYDGNVLSNDIGMFWCISCDYVQIKNATLSTNNPIGVHFFNTSNSVIQNVTTNSNTITGIDISGSGGSSNTLTNNTVSFNNTGIALGSSSSTLTDNTVSSNSTIGISISNFGSSNTLTNNIVLNNGRDINIPIDSEFGDPDITQTLSSNQFKHNMNTAMLTFTETTRTKNVNDLVSFNISMFNPNGTSCSDCSYAITTSPSETVSSSKSGNQVTGSFTATKSGTYSLIFTITDSNSNTTKRNYLFIVGDTGSQTTKYYFRPPTNPTRGQPKGNDAKALLLTAPDSAEEWACFYWIQGSPDEVPNYPLANLSDINTYSWYKSPTITAEKYIGVQRFVGYDAGMDYSSSVPVAADYTWVNKNFANLNWAMDYFHSWYWISLKLYGASDSYWATFPIGETNKSYADFIYQYAATPTVKSVSNPNVVVLSATAPANATSSVSIALENPLSSATSTNFVLPDFSRPFLTATSTIDSNATTTVASPSISAGATSTLSSVPLDITPSSGSIDVAIDTWNTTSTYYKKWTEVGDTPAATAAHTIGDLRANQWYQVKVGGSVTNTLQANSSGEITFTYLGGYSTKTFEVEEETTAPTPFTLISPINNASTDNQPTFFWNASSDAGSGLAKYQLFIDSSLDADNISSTTLSIAPTNTLSCGNHTWYVRAIDNAGNSVNSSTYNFTRSCGGTPLWFLEQINRANQAREDNNSSNDNKNKEESKKQEAEQAQSEIPNLKIEEYKVEASAIFEADVDNIVSMVEKKRDIDLEINVVNKYLTEIGAIAESKEEAATGYWQLMILNFITYGTPSTISLGAGERAGVINSYRQAFNKLPKTKEEWLDVIKIANGRWLNEKNKEAEERAKINFNLVYLREPNRNNPHDNAAITVMAYGLRPAERNLDSEKASIKIFKNIYEYNPEKATAWDVVRAIAYSGAIR